MTPTYDQLWEFRSRDKNSAPGPIWVDEQCLDCDLCRELAPTLFRRNDNGWSYVVKQPETDEEKRQAREAVEGCCVEAIHANGEVFDWAQYPPVKPYHELNRFQKWLRNVFHI